LETTLQEFYDVKESTSRENIFNMNEFANKLPNSRIGSLGNTNIYGFISSPIGTIDIKPVVLEKIVTPDIADSTKDTGVILLIAFSGGCILLALGTLLITKWQSHRSIKRERKEMGA